MPEPIGKKPRAVPKAARPLAEGEARLTKHERILKSQMRGEQLFEPLPKKLTLADIHKLGNGEVQPVKQRPPRFRFAPSPTGKLHIGGARTALMNYLSAKKMGGEFFLRIEDTDRERSRAEYIPSIKEGLQWLGIQWDGDVVVQSERKAIYHAKVAQLVKEGKAYKDATGAVYFKMPTEGTLVLHDELKGKVSVKAGGEGMHDYVLLKPDGDATFKLANVVDDGEQGITHVIRGDDHLINTQLMIPLIKALGYPMPKFWHVPLIHGDDGAKLSKRHGAQGALEFRDMGYPADAVVNHLARLGMSVGTDQTLSLEDLAKHTTMRFATGAAKIGFEKLDSRSKRVIAGTDPKFLTDTVRQRDPALSKRLGPLGLAALIDGSRGRAETYDHISKLGWLLLEEPARREDQLHLYAPDPLKRLMGSLADDLEKLPADQWSAEKLSEVMGDFNKRAKTSYAAYNQSLRWMLTGLADGFPVNVTLGVLGRDESLKRLREAVDPNFKGSVPPPKPGPKQDAEEAAEIVKTLKSAPVEAEPVRPAPAPIEAKPVFDVVVPEVQAVQAEPVQDNRPAVFRYAPTTKAAMGVSGARIALFNYLEAKRTGGKLFVRFEDLDPEKAAPEGAANYLDALKWLGVKFDGEPLVQSQRLGLYNARTDALVAAGKAYVSPEGAVMFRMPGQGELNFHDNVKGLVMAKATDEEMHDFIIRNPDGTPAPLFASVVEDIEANVTRVIRADAKANLTDALRSVSLYDAMGHQPPQYWHIPGLKTDDGKKGAPAQTISELRQAGYRPEVVANHLLRLGVAGVNNPKTLPLDQLVDHVELNFEAEPAKINEAELQRRNQEHP